ncbi:TetR/AcrR family transcriptional regulator [Leifsonia sp. NPDC058248]|uniref:TetR/AcrR family transcriptional regulator n=1 Tax=Leifsonia sp. NPDC058248 TaxID=3346402 RepID=UPI0036DCF57F
MPEYAGRGDAARTMELLWRDGGRDGGRPADGRAADSRPADGRPDPGNGETASRRPPGPRPALDLDRVLDAAIAVADQEGTLAFSLRAVGDQLGTSAMALYSYVPGKAELVDLMYDRVFAEHPGATRDAADADWREGVLAWAEALLGVLIAHPWAIAVSTARPVLGPNEQAVLESLLELLDAGRLPRRTVRTVVTSVFALVRAAAEALADARQAAWATGADDAAWWSGRSAALASAVQDFAERFPLSAQLARDAAADAALAGDAAPWERAPVDALRNGIGLLLASA